MHQFAPSFPKILDIARSCGKRSKAPYLWHDLAGYWPMQDGGGILARDVSGNGNHGTLTNGPTWTNWEKGRGLTGFDTSNGYISVSGQSSLNHTLCAWVLCIGANGYDDIVAVGATGGLLRRHWGTVVANCYGGTLANFGAVTWDDKWKHIALRRTSDTSMEVFINGSLLSSKTQADWAGLPFQFNRIGSRADNPVSGGLANTAFYSRALSPSEIQQLYSDPWAMLTERPRVFPAVTAEAPPASNIPVIMHHRRLMGVS